MESQDFKVGYLNEENFDEVCELMTKIFTDYNALSFICKIKYDDYRAYFQAHRQSWLLQNLSPVVTNVDGKVIGVCILEDFNMTLMDPNVKLPEGILKQSNYYHSMFVKCEVRPAEPKLETAIGETLHGAFCAVDLAYMRQGIAELLAVKTLEIAKSHGFKEIIAIADSPGSQYISVKKSGYSVIHEENLLDFLNSREVTDDQVANSFEKEAIAQNVQKIFRSQEPTIQIVRKLIE
eukprot:403335619